MGCCATDTHHICWNPRCDLSRTADTEEVWLSVGFDGKVIAVAAAGRQISREHALLLASRRAQLVVNDVGAVESATQR